MSASLARDFLERESPSCAHLLQHVFAKILEIDALLYNYTAVELATCKDVQGKTIDSRQAALIIMSEKWAELPGSSVRVFSSETKGMRTERVAIESLFHLSDPLFLNESRNFHDYETLAAKNLLLARGKELFPEFASSLELVGYHSPCGRYVHAP